MLLRTPCTRRIGSTLPCRKQWRRVPVRRYKSTSHGEPSWFQQLRAEMLQRDVTHFPEHITAPHEFQLSQTLLGFLPREMCIAPGVKKPIIPVGHHLVWFNAAVPTNELLPDGTDALQSPGGAWVRRLWAGGSIQVKPDEYFDKLRGFALDTPMAGAEYIKQVELRGEGDDAKIVVTIERRYARVDQLKESYRAEHGSLGRTSGREKIQNYLADQMRNDQGWGNSLLKEERNLFFFKQRNAAEMKAIQAGKMAPVKYLPPPGERHFAYALTPSRTLLFRFSALTFNAHRIHLDPEYARNVEGHRNLLVHGPLSLTLILQVVNSHVTKETEGTQVVESIEYRNLAPLYCDEEMRICGFKKKTLYNGAVYDVWIEGPTGGVAVRGAVYTTVRQTTPSPQNTEPFPQTMTVPAPQPQIASTYLPNIIRSVVSPGHQVVPEYKPSFVRLQDSKLRGAMQKNWKIVEKAAARADKKRLKLLAKEEKALKSSKSSNSKILADTHDSAEPETVSGPDPTPSPDLSRLEPASAPEKPNEPSTSSELHFQPQGENADNLTPPETTSQPQSREVTPSSVLVPSPTYNRKPRTRLRAYKFIISHSSPPPVRVVKSLTPAKPTISLLTKRIIHRLTHRHNSLETVIKPIPLLRKHAARERRNSDVTAARYSRYLQQGVRKFEMPSIRHTTPFKTTMPQFVR